MRKLLVSDYDGTFFINKTDMKKNIYDIRKFRKEGNVFAFATGNNYENFIRVIEKNDIEYDYLFTKDKPILFVFHGYPNLIRELVIDRNNKNIKVIGYQEEGAITTPFDMRVKNEIDRFNICLDVMKLIDDKYNKFDVTDYCIKELIKHNAHIKMFGTDLEEVENWKWSN